MIQTAHFLEVPQPSKFIKQELTTLELIILAVDDAITPGGLWDTSSGVALELVRCARHTLTVTRGAVQMANTLVR